MHSSYARIAWYTCVDLDDDPPRCEMSQGRGIVCGKALRSVGGIQNWLQAESVEKQTSYDIFPAIMVLSRPRKHLAEYPGL